MLALARKAQQDPRKAVKKTIDLAINVPRRLAGYSVFYVIYAMKRIRTRDYIVVSPARPHWRYSLWKLATLSGIAIVAEGDAGRTPARSPLARFRHDDDTWDDLVRPGLINGRCLDISKTKVDKLFEEAFGYCTRLDPTTFSGTAVMKSEENYSGGGQFVQCPIKKEEVRDGYIYQKLVDNRIDDERVKEYRVSVIGGEAVDVIVQWRTISRRLKGRGSGGGLGTENCRPEAVFSATELAQINRFCDLMGLEFAELDVLPDVNEGRIYILDANKTPTAMVSGSSFTPSRFRNLLRRAAIFDRALRARPASA